MDCVLSEALCAAEVVPPRLCAIASALGTVGEKLSPNVKREGLAFDRGCDVCLCLKGVDKCSATRIGVLGL